MDKSKILFEILGIAILGVIAMLVVEVIFLKKEVRMQQAEISAISTALLAESMLSK